MRLISSLSIWLVAAQFFPSCQCGQNPIIPGFNPDPSPLRMGDSYYLATSSFEYFPGIPLYKSEDLVNWELFTHVLSRPGQLSLYGVPTGAGAWAPSLSHSNGTYYLATMTRWTYDPVARVWPRIQWVTSTDLVTWSDPIWGEPWGIDPSIFHDAISGKDYLNLMAPNNDEDRLWGIYQCQVDLVSGLCVGEYRSLWNGTLPVNASARPEGPKMFHKSGYYYLLIAEGGTDLLHRSSIARSRSPEGPWESAPNNPILYNGDSSYGNLTVQSTGHGTMITTPDNDWYIVYLARRNVNGSSPVGRETFISGVQWQDGWPIVNNGQPVLLNEPVQGLPPKREQKQIRTHKFSTDLAGECWYTLRTPYTPIYSVQKQGFTRNVDSANASHEGATRGELILHPNVFGLSDRDVPAAVLRKQTSLNMTFSAQTLPLPDSLRPGATIGISAYLSELVHHDVGISGCRNASSLCVYTSLARNGTEQYSETILQPPASREIELVIRAEPLEYSLGFRSSNATDVQWLARFDSYWMAWAPTDYFVFEGVMFALFASGGGLPWTASGPVVGFSKATEVFFEQSIGNYDTL